MIKLTARQEQILNIIKRCISETGYPPTRAEIAKELGFKSANAAEEHLKALAKKGAIEMVAGASRGIRLPEEVTGIPLIGRVAAGNPVLAQENIEEYCNIPSDFFHPPADYLLRVTGLSMRDIGILDGDLLAVHNTDQARNGDIVIARIEDEVTVKRFQHEAGSHLVQLFPENEEFEVINVDLRDESFAIEGKSVGILRRD